MNLTKYKTIDNCRACFSKNLKNIFSLGSIFVSDFINSISDLKVISAPLELVLCKECSLLQLKHTVESSALYRNYWYQSGINESMVLELHNIVKSSIQKIFLLPGDYVVDIGANDGTLLRAYDKNIFTVGFEPANNLKEMNSVGTKKIFNDFFNYDTWATEFKDKKAKIITAIGMFYDLDDPNKFIMDVYKILADDGIFVIQMMYVPFFLNRNAFDGICHEHLEYYTLLSLENLLKRHNLEVFDLEIREKVNEGSVRFFIKKKNSIILGAQDIGAKERIANLRRLESKLKMSNDDTYLSLIGRIIDAKEKTLSFIKEQIADGKLIHGYAASTKGNTTLQFYGLTTQFIEAIADRNQSKWGLYTVGTNIPIISEEESRRRKPDFYFILAWHFLPQFIEREKNYLNEGGKFIVSMPIFSVINKENYHSFL